MRRIAIFIILVFLYFVSCRACLGQDPNIPVLRVYRVEPNEVCFFAFDVIDLDADAVTVSVSGHTHWLNSPMVDPNGMKWSYSGDLVSKVEGDIYLLLEANDSFVSVFAYLRIEVKRKNRPPVIL